MAAIRRELSSLYQLVNYELSDPRTNDWFLINTPWPVIGILTVYLYLIFRIIPSLMANRPPMKLERIIQVYDVVQIILSTYIFYKAGKLAWFNDYSYYCEPVDYSYTPKAIEIAGMVYFYFIVKIIDLLDTLFFVLRKKDNQVSFLHVYHHTGMVMFAWIGVKYVAGGHGTFMGFVNSFVHMVMYTHYLVMSFKLFKPWWKKYITQLQLLQFILIFFHFVQLAWTKDCKFPRWITIVFIPQNFFMIAMFADFYYKTYIKKPVQKLPVDQNEHSSTEMPNNKSKED